MAKKQMSFAEKAAKHKLHKDWKTIKYWLTFPPKNLIGLILLEFVCNSSTSTLKTYALKIDHNSLV